MPNRPANITKFDSSGLHVLNQNLREIQIRIDDVQNRIPVHRIVKATPILNFGSIPANGFVERAGTVTGATQQGAVHASHQLQLGNNNLIIAAAYVSGKDQVTVRLYNPTANPITPNTVKWNLACVL